MQIFIFWDYQGGRHSLSSHEGPEVLITDYLFFFPHTLLFWNCHMGFARPSHAFFLRLRLTLCARERYYAWLESLPHFFPSFLAKHIMRGFSFPYLTTVPGDSIACGAWAYCYYRHHSLSSQPRTRSAPHWVFWDPRALPAAIAACGRLVKSFILGLLL